YLRLELRLGALMTVLLGLALWLGQVLAAQSTLVRLGSGLGMFVVGWVIQFGGHEYEGREPAVVDDLTGRIVWPGFVGCEAGYHRPHAQLQAPDSYTQWRSRRARGPGRGRR
ncbi:hypothetical protein B1218_36200, partial [Pseudomonas ogarae]